jgi:alpha-L-fucosidase
MKKQTITIVLIAGVMVMQMLITPLAAQTEDKSMEKETAQQRDARMAWWRQARFGMFVHWGLYSGLAGTWKDKAVGTRGGMEWIQNYVNADTWEYDTKRCSVFSRQRFCGRMARWQTAAAACVLNHKH